VRKPEKSGVGPHAVLAPVKVFSQGLLILVPYASPSAMPRRGNTAALSQTSATAAMPVRPSTVDGATSGVGTPRPTTGNGDG